LRHIKLFGRTWDWKKLPFFSTPFIFIWFSICIITNSLFNLSLHLANNLLSAPPDNITTQPDLQQQPRITTQPEDEKPEGIHYYKKKKSDQITHQYLKITETT
jgi:hypothetical protein